MFFSLLLFIQTCFVLYFVRRIESSVKVARQEIKQAALKMETLRNGIWSSDQVIKEHIRELARIDSRLDIFARSLYPHTEVYHERFNSKRNNEHA